MRERKDLTHWNRAGLTHFRYMDGNAVEYLEILRQQLYEKFHNPKTKRCKWLNPAVEITANEVKPESKTETLIQRQERLSRRQKRIQEMYRQDRRDWAWEITRTFARACHILTEHTNAYANEGYLGTATQWDNVRRLVEMLDYHPAPPASATTRLVLEAKDNKSGFVTKGFQIEHSPAMGGDKVVFETLEDLFIDPALNELRPKGWNLSNDPLIGNGGDGDAQGAETTTKAAQQATRVTKLPSSEILMASVDNLQDISGKRLSELNKLVRTGEEAKIKDLLYLDPDDPPAGLTIPKTLLREFRAKARMIADIELEAGWESIKDWPLSKIVSEKADVLMEHTGYTLRQVKSLKQKMDLLETCLNHSAFQNTILQDLWSQESSEDEAEDIISVASTWRAPQKPKVSSEQVAMIFSKTENKAEAATIHSVDETSGDIHLLLDQIECSWTTWPKGEVALHVSPRWKRECWLNGNNVIRTKEPHGLSDPTKEPQGPVEASYICWKVDNEWREYALHLRSVTNTGDLEDEGRSLVIVARVGDQLHIRIFDASGVKVVDKAENELFGGRALAFLRQLSDPLPAENRLSEDEKQKIIENAASCAELRYAKVTEADTRDLRLEVTESLPQEGADLYELRPIKGSILPADYEAVVLLKDTTPLTVENVNPEIEASPDPDDPNPRPRLESIFELKKVIPGELEGAEAGGGGGLLPPASLPKIGSFLFPSPMLPMDLVKAAVELMLSIGVMAIPSTKKIVIKGMPFVGRLEGATSEAEAAAKLYDMLDKLVGNVESSVQATDPDGNLLWKLKDPPGGFSTYTEGEDDKESYELDNDNNLVPVPKAIREKLVTWLITDSNGNPDRVRIESKLTEMLSTPDGKEATTLFQKIKNDIFVNGPLLAMPKKPIVKAVVETSEPPYMFNGTPGKIASGDWVVGQFTKGLKALAVKKYPAKDKENTDTDKETTAKDNTEYFSLTFENLDGNEGELQKVYADFRRDDLIAEGATVNNNDVDAEKIELDLEDVPDNLKPGREVLLTAEGKDPVPAKIESIVGNTITTAPPATDFKKGELIICGNVVLAGHGERMPAKILGSGNAARSNQEFILEVEEVSFTPDATKRSGVAAAIEVEVDGRVWEQVSTLKDSAPGDHHYAIRMTEEGYVKILFGDSEYGRRLSTGKNNIRVRYRVGTGLAGNVESGSLEKPVNPHPFVKTIKQPLRATGGGDMEDLTSLRENAPPTLLALERAVSLSDYKHLAASQSSVWQANAYNKNLFENRMESVEVVIVPAGGKTSTDTQDEIQKFLQRHALPGVHVTVVDCNRNHFSLSVKLRIKKDQFIADDVVNAVKFVLTDHFKLQNRKLGEHLYLSEVYKVVEGVKAVENSLCVLNYDDSLKLVRADNERMVVYLDTGADENPSTLSVTREEYRP